MNLSKKTFFFFRNVITWKEMEQNKELKILCKDLIFAYLQLL